MKKTENENGSITVEATLAILIFMIMFIAVINIIDSIIIQARIQKALNDSAEEISVYSYLVSDNGNTAWQEELSTVILAGNGSSSTYLSKYNVAFDVVDDFSYLKDLVLSHLEDHNYSNDYLAKAGVVGGADGIDLSASVYNYYGDGMLRITATYKTRIVGLPFLDGLNFTKDIIVNASTRLWRD